MVAQKLSVNGLVVLLLLGLAMPLMAEAVGGTVRDASASGTPPLGEVKVAIQQTEKVRDTTRDDDGAYVLTVPGSYDKIDIIFKKNGYTNAFDSDVPNDGSESSKKRPVVYMAKRGTIKSIPKEQLEAIVANTLKAAEHAQKNKLPALLEAAKENLALFKDELRDPAEGIRDKIRKIEQAVDK